MKLSCLIFLILASLLAGCQGYVPDAAPDDSGEDRITEIITEASFPEMNFSASSRSLGEQPVLDQLHVNLFVFDKNGVMLQFIGPEDVEVVAINEADKIVTFKVRNIYSSSQPRRLHFVVSSVDDLHAQTGGEYITAMASETTTMPALVVSDGNDAYWGVHEVESITDNMSLHIKLIRNFVKLSVKLHENVRKFKLLGYTVVNRPNRGTVAPFIYRDHLFAQFLNPENQLRPYEEIIADGYLGVNPAGSDTDLTCTGAEEVEEALSESERRIAAGEADTPCYIYERTQSSFISAGKDTQVTYLIVKGIYNNKVNYYKIDIGQDKDGKFAFYDLIRNFQYTLLIKEVGGEGAESVRDAMNGAVHNNLSASIVNSDLFSIGYDNEKIEVSATTVTFTEKTEDYELRFRYTPAGNEAIDAEKLRVYDLTKDAEYSMTGVGTSNPKAIDLSGEVIRKAELIKDSDGWYILRVSTGETPTDSRWLEQNIRVYYSGGAAGLGRTISFMARKPWEYKEIKVSSAPATTMKSDFTIDFTLPDGMPSYLFPLVWVFESDKQNIYAKSGTDLLVNVGNTGFEGATTDKVTFYQWRIEWEDYASRATGNGALYQANFRMNTSATEDQQYSTASIDRASIAGRTANNGTSGFCIKVSLDGQQFFKPYYLNVARSN